LTSTVNQTTTPILVNNGPGTLTDGTDGRLLIHVDLTNPQGENFFMTPAAANTNGYVGTGTLNSATVVAQGSSSLIAFGGGNETVQKSTFAHITAAQTVNYYYIVQGSFSGEKFNDASNLGVKDPAEVGLSGWTMTLTGTEDQITDPSDPSHILYAGGAIAPIVHTTAAGGTFSFNSLNPGTYTVTETGQAGWTETFPAAGATYTVNVAADGTVTIHPSNNPQLTVQSADFGNHQSVFEISGFKYNDAADNDNSGGIVGQGDDVELNGVTIVLYTESNGLPGLQTGSGGDSFVTQNTHFATVNGSTHNGYFSFSNLDATKSYYLLEQVPVNSIQTFGGTALNPVVIQGFDGASTGNYFANYTPPNTGSTATIGFWQNRNGIKVIQSGGQALVDWLKGQFPNLYGSLTDNASVEALFVSGTNSYFGSKGPKTNAQVMNIALAIYFSDVANNATAQGYGFTSGTGSIMVNVGANGASFGLPNGTIAPLLTLLHDVDAHTVNGVIWGGSGPLWLGVNNVFDVVANMYDI
jgi:hypothetical protein